MTVDTVLVSAPRQRDPELAPEPCAWQKRSKTEHVFQFIVETLPAPLLPGLEEEGALILGGECRHGHLGVQSGRGNDC